MSGPSILDGGLDEAIQAAIGHALTDHIAVVVRRDGCELLIIFPDTLLVELLANGTAITGIHLRRDDGRTVRVYANARVRVRVLGAVV